MTAEEWQQSVDLDAMLRALDHRASERKLRLFGVACCRRLRQRLPENSHGLELIEGFADGQPRGKEYLLDAWRTSVAAYVAYGLNRDNMAMAAANAARAAPDWNAERLAQCDLLRDLFDPLFWAVAVDPSWINPLVRSIAQAIYEEHCFEDLPILADALEEAGCDDATVLEHCRSASPHARGCWLIDLLTGRS